MDRPWHVSEWFILSVVLKEEIVALRDSMRDSAAQYLRPGEPIQAVIGAQTASAWLAGLTGFWSS